MGYIANIREADGGTTVTLKPSPSTMDLPISPTSIILYSAGFYLFYKLLHFRYGSLRQLKGPPTDSWIVGNFGEYLRPKEIAELDFQWIREYGSTMRVHGVLGKDFLFTVDPKALQYIFNTSGYNFPKPPETRISVALTTGKGLAWAEGQQHARQRKIMNPAFSYGALRVFLPLFRHTVQKTAGRFKEILANNNNAPTVIDVHPWMARTTLDAIGAAAFDYQFNAIEDGTNPLLKAYHNLFADTFFERSDGIVLFEELSSRLPEWCHGLMRNLPNPQMRRLKEYMKIAREVAQSILDRQSKLHEAGKEGSKDVMSILIRANLAENPKNKLSDEEILCQLTTLNLAGHETTANTITWALYELSRHRDFQTEVRDEIAATRARAAERGDTELSVADLDSMRYLLALMKETLRYHPIVTTLIRAAAKDDVIPLSFPVQSKTGQNLESIPIRKGQRIMLSIAGYHRLKSVWGEDADEWNPHRFLEGVERYQSTALGVTSNVVTFSSGLRSCIGWRFGMIEMQTVLIELLENFEFLPPPGNIQIIRAATGLMTPMVKDAKVRKTELPLTVVAL